MNNIKYSTKMLPKKNPWKPWIFLLVIIFMITLAIYPEFYGRIIGIWTKELIDAFQEGFTSKDL